MMRASRNVRTATSRTSGAAKRTAARRGGKPAGKAAEKPAVKPAVKHTAVAPEPVLFRFCKPGWGVLVERLPSMQGTRFVCPFCTHSHRVSGPVRGFRKVRKAQWVKLRRVDE